MQTTLIILLYLASVGAVLTLNHAGSLRERRQKRAQRLEVADVQARREQAQRIGKVDPKSIHNGAV